MKKVIMAVTGLMLICFLLMHMFGNLKVFIGPEAYNHYAEWLQRDILYPLLPHGWFIWIFRAVMLAALVLHIYCAAKVWAASIRGRGSSQGLKYTRVNRPERTLSSKLMRWGGITLGALLLFHLLMFTTKSITFGVFDAESTPYDMFRASFDPQLWYIFVIYLVFMVAVCFHVRHGFYSAFTTLGANVSPAARGVLNALAYFVATLIFVGFILPPAASVLGLLEAI
ncbi:MAG: succinate dehydrogenase cytochrome b subunit [Propionibacteriaceae bacterium]|nr:succinate dehydrogenase cytochrome b subunit [Propionibacteriaceae bacterium]